MAAGDLTTLKKVKAWLGVNAGTEDELLQQLLSSASTFMQSKMNRTIMTASYSETRDGLGSDALMLANYPVTAVSSLQVNGRAILASPGYGQAGYLFNDTQIILATDVFTQGRRNVTVSYTAGFSACPADIEESVIEMVGFKYRERDRIGHKSKSIQGEMVTFITDDMPASVLAVVNSYKRVAPLL